MSGASESGPQVYSIENSADSGTMAFDPGGGAVSLKPGGRWETSDPVAYWNAINSTTYNGSPVSPKMEGIGYDQLANLVQGMSGASAPNVTPVQATGTDSTPPIYSSPATASSPTPSSDESKYPSPSTPTTRSSPQSENAEHAADPVDLFTGEFVIEETDLDIPQGVAGLHFTRMYRSGPPVFCPFGWNWDHNHNVYLRELATGDVARWNGKMHEDIFKFVSGGPYKPPRGVFEKLTKSSADLFTIDAPGGIQLTFQRQTALSDVLNSIPLVQISDKFGNVIRYLYEEGFDGRIRITHVISDTDKRFFRFHYGSCGLLEKVEDRFDNGTLESGSVTMPLGLLNRSVQYFHDPDIEHMTRVVHLDESGTIDGVSTEYSYPDPSVEFYLRHCIDIVADGNGTVYVENEYDADPSSLSYGKVISQTFGEFVYQFQYQDLQVVPPPDVYSPIRPEVRSCPARQTLMIAPDQAQSLYTFNYRGDLLDQRTQISRSGLVQTLIVMNEYDLESNLTKSKVRKSDTLQWSTKTVLYPYVESIVISNIDLWDPRVRDLATKVTLDDGLTSRITWQATYDLPTSDPASHYQNLLTETDEWANQTQYSYSTDKKQLLQISHPTATLPDSSTQAATTQFGYDATGRVMTLTSPLGYVEQLAYDTTVTNRNSFRRLIQRTRYLTLTIGAPQIDESFTYDHVGFVAGFTDGNGQVTSFANSIRGWIRQITLPTVGTSTPVITHEYDPDGHITKTNYPKGDYTETGLTDSFLTETISRDVLGHTKRTDFGSNTKNPFTILRRNDYRGNPIAIIDPLSNSLVMTYDERGLLLDSRGQGADGTTSLYKKSYDTLGNPVAEVFGPNSDVLRTYKFDAFGRIVETREQGIASPGSTPTTKLKTEISYGTTDTTYPVSGQLLVSKTLTEYPDSGSPNMLSKVYTAHDERGRIVVVRTGQFDNTTQLTPTFLDTQYYHDADNNLTKIVGPQSFPNQASLFEFDGIGRLLKETDPEGNQRLYTYDNLGNVTQLERKDKDVPNGGTLVSRIWSSTYDERSRIKTLTEPDSGITSYTFDDRNLLTKVTDALGVVTSFEYGLTGEVLKQIHDAAGLNIVSQWAYDQSFRPIQFTDPSGQVTNYSYDGLGRLTKTLLPGGAFLQRNFGADGRLLTETIASGATLSYSYDVYGRLQTLQGTGGSDNVQAVPVHSYTYDGLDRLLTGTLPTGPNVSRTYDSLNHILTESNHGITLQGTYNLTSGQLTRKWSDGRVETLDLNLNGIVKKVNRTTAGGLGNDTTPLLDQLKMYGPSLIGEASLFGTNLKISAHYDNRLRLNSLKHFDSVSNQNIELVEYRFDALNRRRIEKISNAANAQPQSRLHVMDAKDRLAQTNDAVAPNTLTVGVTSQTQNDSDISSYASGTPSNTLAFTLNQADERSQYSETSPALTRNYSYGNGHRMSAAGSDSAHTYADGPLKDIGSQSYTIDALGRTVKLDTNYSITFDALSRPAILDDGTTIRKLCYFGDELWQELAGSSVDRQYSHHSLLFGPLAIHIASGTYVPMTDARMNRLALTDSSGAIIDRYRYSPYGETNSTSAIGLEPWFGGMRYISSKALYVGQIRVMNPKHGLWLGIDPVGYADSPNLYSYCGANPIDFVDPLGRSKNTGPAEDNIPVFSYPEIVVTPKKRHKVPVHRKQTDSRNISSRSWDALLKHLSILSEKVNRHGQARTESDAEAFKMLNSIQDDEHRRDRIRGGGIKLTDDQIRSQAYIHQPAGFLPKQMQTFRASDLIPSSLSISVSATSAVGSGVSSSFDLRFYLKGPSAGQASLFTSDRAAAGVDISAGVSGNIEYFTGPDAEILPRLFETDSRAWQKPWLFRNGSVAAGAGIWGAQGSYSVSSEGTVLTIGGSVIATPSMFKTRWSGTGGVVWTKELLRFQVVQTGGLFPLLIPIPK